MNGKIKITDVIKYFNIAKIFIIRKIFLTGYPFIFKGLNKRLNYVPSNKFKINFKKFPKININKLKSEYNDLPNYITYKN